MSYYNQYGGWGNNCDYGGKGGGEVFVLIVVLFILLVIVGSVIV